MSYIVHVMVQDSIGGVGCVKTACETLAEALSYQQASMNDRVIVSWIDGKEFNQSIMVGPMFRE
jgi:hypothetical protein